uniref:Tektin n=1 Tax=Anas platyrhynchos TaxID=8839 RepID=A0A8B9T246_ANAPL
MLIFCSLAVACSGEMATLSVKPGQRFTVPDWHTNANLISADAESQRSASHRVRQETRALRNETNNQAKWDEHDNQTRLTERISSVNRWKETLDKCLADIDEEIDALAKVCWEDRWLEINLRF